MMEFSVLLLLGLAQPQPADAELLIRQIRVSGRVLTIGEDGHKLADPRKDIAPGAPPLLAFRYFEGAERHRFGNLDLVLDDAGH